LNLISEIKVGRTSKSRIEKSSNKKASINGKLKYARQDEIAFKRFKNKFLENVEEEILEDFDQEIEEKNKN